MGDHKSIAQVGYEAFAEYYHGPSAEPFRDQGPGTQTAWEHAAEAIRASVQGPIPMRLTCPHCAELHIDEGEFATRSHHTHACQCCGAVWRPAVVHTVGVRFLPGFKNEEAPRG